MGIVHVLARTLKLAAALGAATAALAAAVPANATSPLVLQPREAPGLRPVRTSVAGAKRALAAALRPARLPALRTLEAAASRYVHGGTELLSAAFVLRTPSAADAAIRKATATRGLVKSRVRVGERGWLVRRRGGRAAPIVVLWRRDRGLGAIVLRTPRAARELAVDYASLADVHLARALTETTWQRTLDRIRPDGTVPRQVALDLFALAYGPLPGTRVPRGAYERVEEGTMAARGVLSIWSTLPPAQRAAALHALGLSGVEVRRGRAYRDRADGLRTRREFGDPNFTVDAGLTAQANEWAKIYAQKLGALPFTIVAGHTSTKAQTAANGKIALLDTLPVDATGILSDAARFCRIRVLPSGQPLQAQGPLFALLMAHEVFHCFQDGLTSPTALLKTNRKNWVLEGMADWAAVTVTHASWELGGANMAEYLGTCDTRDLFGRVYDAVGFFGHVAETSDLWSAIPNVLKAGDGPDAYAAAGGASTAFLHSWGSSAMLEPWSLDWYAQNPVKPPTSAACGLVPLVAPTFARAERYRVRPYEITTATAPPDRPLLNIRLDGYGRLGDGTVDTTALEDAWFCLRKECKCPPGEEGRPPPAPHLNLPANLGLTGGPDGSTAIVVARKLDEYCKKRQPPPPPPPGGPPIGGAGGGCSVGAAPRRVSSATTAVAAGGGCGSSNGDPHLHTFDGRFYDFQAAGEFVLVRSGVDGLEVQAREEPYPSSNAVAINTAVAMRVEGDRVVVSRGEPVPVVRVNGSGFVPASRPRALPHGGRIRVVQGQIEVAWKDGTLARAWSVSTWGVAFLFRPVTTRQGTLTGLLGNFDGNDANDFVTRRSRRLDTTAVIGYDERAYRLLYRVFGESWRITQRQSLFDYAPGQSTRTFTNRRFPARIVRARDLPPGQRRAAERTCRRLHIRNPRVREDCVLDVGVTGDNRFATSARQLERTAGRFGKPQKRRRGPPTTSAVGRWARVATGPSATAVPSVAVAGSTVVAAYATGAGSAEAATFTLSPANAVAGLRRNPIASGWTFLDNLSLIPTAGGGLQLLLHGIHGGTTADPLSGETLFPRNADGSFGPPTRIASADQSALGGAAALAPDGTPIWASVTRGFWLWRGFPEATSAGLPNLPAPAYVPSVGRDAMGRYWLAWYVLGSTAQTKGLYLVQIDPQTLQPVSAPQRAPSSGTLDNLGNRLALACAAVCRVVYLAPGAVVSWAFGERTPTRVAAIPRGHRLRPDLAAAYTARGRLWAAWFDRTANRYGATLGNGAGAGGRVLSLGHPAGTVSTPGALAGVGVGERLTLVVTWSGRRAFTRHVKIVSP